MSLKQKAIEWLVLAIAIFIAANIIPGMSYDSLQSLAVAALVLSLINSFIKPLFFLISLPFIVLTMGLFLLVINTLLLMLTAFLVKGFHVESFWSALGGALIISLISSIFSFSSAKAVRMTKTPPPSTKIPDKNNDVIDI